MYYMLLIHLWMSGCCQQDNDKDVCITLNVNRLQL